MLNYSLIIPHHNCPELLDRLLNTIKYRDDSEIIVIDDNSDPNIVNFDDFPGTSRNDVKVIFSKDKGRGAGHARNLGVAQANGKWLLFADSDDYYNTSNLEALKDKYMNVDDIDIVYLNAQMVDESGNVVGNTYITNYIQNYLNNRFFSEKVLRYGVWEPWNRMVKRDVVISNNICFDEIPVGNDQMFSLKCSRYSKRISVETDVVYNYFKPIGRSTTNKYRHKLELLPQFVDLKMRSNSFYSEVGYPFKTSFLKIYLQAQDGGENKRIYRKKNERVS